MGESLKDGLLLGMGNPLLDISAVVEQSLLDKYELQANMACLAEEKHKPLYHELIEKYEVDYIAGGAVQNSLRVAQWLLQRPHTAVFMGCVGKDKFSDILESKAKADGVSTHYQYTEQQPTGTCAVLITDNGTHRTLCANLAAANCFTPDHLDKPENAKCLDNAEFYYISGFFLTVSPDSILKVAKYALEKNRCFMMNLSAPFICEFYRKQQMEVYPYVDVIFGNETEALAFANANNFGTTDIKEIAEMMSALPKKNSKRSRIAVITQGADPVIVVRDGLSQLFPVAKLPAEKIVDTNGAGDAFVGGYLSQLIQGKDIKTCVACGIWTASEIIQHSGCSFNGKPTFNTE